MSYPDSLSEREAMFARRVEDSWVGCYDEPWKGDLIEAAFQHPAKISRGLARRIYAHAVERGWLKAGDCVLDPFAGIGGTALDAMAHGLHWTGVELEPRFCEMCKANLALWETKYGRLPGWGSARIIQGDSRKLSELVGGADAVVGSPPFNENRANQIHGQSKGFHSYDENESKNRCKRDYALPEHPDNLGMMSMDDASGNIGLNNGTTFWSAARQIVLETRKVLKPQGVAIWVTKDFVRRGRRVPFSDQWQALCESCGFTLLERHRAMLVKDLGTQNTMFGEPEELKRERKSFFRRLAEKKGSPAIDWEDVLVLSS